MTYSVSGLIQATDYNTFAQGGDSPDPNTANLNTIWGAGSLDKGWGQSTPVSTVSPAATVTATQWSTLFSRFTAIANQTGTSVTAIVNPTVGDTVAVKTNFSTNLSSCFTGRNNAAAVGTTITSGGVATFSTAWSNLLTATHTITFADANSARYFFNAGGIITWAGARTGGTSSSENTAWTNLLTACGTINTTTGTSTQTIAGTSYTGTTKTGGSGTPTTLLTDVGFYDLTTSNQEVFKQLSSTYLYTSSYVSINIKANASVGSATIITITVAFNDAHVASPYHPDDIINGTLTSTVTAVQPSTSYLTNTWGTPALSSSIVETAYSGSYVLVGGGGGGGYSNGGGGGGGQFYVGVAGLTVGTTYNITVGAAGTASTSSLVGTAGGNSTGFGQTAVGGGLGASSSAVGSVNGGAGGNGGGGAGAGTGTGGTGTAGFNGGAGSLASTAGGGGGGAGSVGQAAATDALPAGAGGLGLTTAITGTTTFYAAGGGGGSANTSWAIGGSGIGGQGGYSGAAGGAAVTNSGAGGGGGGVGQNGGAGAAGVVILSVPTAKYTGTVTGTYTTGTNGSNTWILWTSGSGSYVA